MSKNPPYLSISLAGTIALLFAGCGTSDGPATFPVRGIVELESAEPDLLAGHNIELSLDSDPTVRAFAEIQPDGHFDLTTLHNGKVQSGALEGTYKARIVLSDDNPESRKNIVKRIDPKALNFESTPFVVQVPTSDQVTISVKRR